jgi:DNA polymerase-3 subunit alpha
MCDIPKVGFEILHLHTNYSLLDGYGSVEEYAKRASSLGHQYLSISDHGMMAAIPQQIKFCEQYKLEPIFAIEAYVNKMQKPVKDLEENQELQKDMTEEEKKYFRSSAHLLMIAYNQQGYKNLVKLSSWGWLNGFYKKPRVNHEVLQQYKEGIIFTSCCYNSEIGRAFDFGGEDLAEEEVKNYIRMFGKEHFYLEIMLLDFKKQKPYNCFIYKMAKKYGLKAIITTDTHYCNPEDSKYQRMMLMIQTKRTIQDIERALKEDSMQDFFELQDGNLWFKSEQEINEKWEKDYKDTIPYEFFEECKRNTVKICELAKGVKLDRSLKLPVLNDADDILREEVVKGLSLKSKSNNAFKQYQTQYKNRILEIIFLIYASPRTLMCAVGI